VGAAMLPQSLSWGAGSRMSKVVKVVDSSATQGMTINAAVVQQMVNAGVMELTGQADLGEAWKSLFPGITSSSKLSMKLCLADSPFADGLMKTHLEVTQAVTAGVLKMDLSGSYLPPEQILWWDLDKSQSFNYAPEYVINWGGPGVQVYYLVQNYMTWRPNGNWGNGLGFDPNVWCTVTQPGADTNHHLGTIVTQHTDYMLNLAVLKYHSTALVTGVLKNHYGTFDNIAIANMHYNGAGVDDGIPSLNAFLRDNAGDKEKFCLIDGLWGTYSTHGSGSQFNPNLILMATDPVAIDRIMLEIINTERAAHGMGALAPGHISNAAQAPYNLGTDDLAQIELVEIIDPSTPPTLTVRHSGDDVVLMWDARPGANGYSIYRSTDPYNIPTGGLPYATSSDTIWIDTGVLTGPNDYFYKVTSRL
jgi:hypothetical protein